MPKSNDEHFVYIEVPVSVTIRVSRKDINELDDRHMEELLDIFIANHFEIGNYEVDFMSLINEVRQYRDK